VVRIRKYFLPIRIRRFVNPELWMDPEGYVITDLEPTLTFLWLFKKLVVRYVLSFIKNIKNLNIEFFF
jgi:hypothetical protein